MAVSGLTTTQLCAMTLTVGMETSEGGSGSAPLVFLFRGNPDNYVDPAVQSVAPVAPATQAQLKANLGVIVGVTNLLQSGSFKRVTIDGLIGAKRAKRELIIPSAEVAILVDAIEAAFASGNAIKIGSGNNALDAHGAAVGLKRVMR